MESFVAFDIETANRDASSICEIAFVKFDVPRDDDDYPAIYTLIRPQGKFSVDVFNTEVHGLLKEDLLEAPHLADIWSEVEDFLGDLPLVAHGATNDINKLIETLSLAGITMNPREFYCSLVTARNIPDVLSDLPFKLQNLAALAGVDWFEVTRPSGLPGHHALIDAIATGKTMLSYLDRYSGSLHEMTTALGMRAGQIDFGRVIHGNTKLKDTSYFQRYLQYSEKTFEDRKQLLREQGFPIATEHRFSNQNIVLTLELEGLSAKEFWDGVALCGGNYKSALTKKVNFLIEGTTDPLGRYLPGESPKSLKAIELNDKGSVQISVVSQEECMEIFGDDVLAKIREIADKGI